MLVYVSPSGSSADSAGAVIGQAADVLAMAPQTNIGSSTPISTNGQDFSKDLRRKVVNDAAAYIGELAREHGRNAALGRADGAQGDELRRAGRAPPERRRRRRADAARAARRRSTAADAAEGVRRSTRPGAQVERVEMSLFQRARDLLIDPNLIELMLSLGLVGHPRRALAPGADLPRHGRRDLAPPRALRAPGATRLGRRRRADPARVGVLRSPSRS